MLRLILLLLRFRLNQLARLRGLRCSQMNGSESWEKKNDSVVATGFQGQENRPVSLFCQ